MKYNTISGPKGNVQILGDSRSNNMNAGGSQKVMVKDSNGKVHVVNKNEIVN